MLNTPIEVPLLFLLSIMVGLVYIYIYVFNMFQNCVYLYALIFCLVILIACIYMHVQD